MDRFSLWKSPKPPRKAGLRILMAAAEVRPYAWVGGLGDVVASLSSVLAAHGNEVIVASPLHRSVRKVASLQLASGCSVGPHSFQIFFDEASDNPHYLFIEHDGFFDREGVYTDAAGREFGDQFERFHFFNLAVLATMRKLKLHPEIVHCHDSHSALIPAFLRYGPDASLNGRRARTVLTIHNLAHQGAFPAEKFEKLEIPARDFHPASPFEFYGQVNMLKAGLVYADGITTVSPNYAREILTPEHGFGLDGVLRQRQDDLVGILNGIDTEQWNPRTDPHIPSRYGPESLSRRKVNGLELRKAFGLPDFGGPLIGIVARLVQQKGLDLVLEVQRQIADLGFQLIILGRGEQSLEQGLVECAENFPEQVSVRLEYSDRLARLIEAGCDIYLMPSRFEPCGLNQMYSMRYGAVPVVHRIGGLADTVQDWRPETQEGTGFAFEPLDADALLTALGRALSVWNNPSHWEILMKNGMAQDFSWDQSAKKYLDLYGRMIHPFSKESGRRRMT